MSYQDLRDQEGHLLARLDPERWLLEIQRRGEKTLFDLCQFLAPGILPPERRFGIVLPPGLDQMSVLEMQKAILQAIEDGERMPISWKEQLARTANDIQAELAKHPEWLAPQSAKENDGERRNPNRTGETIS